MYMILEVSVGSKGSGHGQTVAGCQLCQYFLFKGKEQISAIGISFKDAKCTVLKFSLRN